MYHLRQALVVLAAASMLMHIASTATAAEDGKIAELPYQEACKFVVSIDHRAKFLSAEEHPTVFAQGGTVLVLMALVKLGGGPAVAFCEFSPIRRGHLALTSMGYDWENCHCAPMFYTRDYRSVLNVQLGKRRW